MEFSEVLCWLARVCHRTPLYVLRYSLKSSLIHPIEPGLVIRSQGSFIPFIQSSKIYLEPVLTKEIKADSSYLIYLTKIKLNHFDRNARGQCISFRPRENRAMKLVTILLLVTAGIPGVISVPGTPGSTQDPSR